MSGIQNWCKWRKGKTKRSELARRAINMRWERYHATKALDPAPIPIPDPCYQLTIENFVVDESHVLIFHLADKINRFRITVDGKDWSTCGWSKALARVRKSCVKMAAK